MRKFLFVILQCTWGIGATLVGLVFFIKNRKCPRHRYRGAVDIRWNNPYGGLSLGLFIFTPNVESEHAEQVRVHEYGHCIQNIVLGPLMLIVGAISVIWANHPHFVRKRREQNIRYTSCFVESWASKWGEAVTKKKAVWD
ncbi:MAG: hypothetical protein K6F93_01800 [Lachnospiraceae bacterium]|nr:hypothetical protein [Lachnospiraceae bacterium]